MKPWMKVRERWKYTELQASVMYILGENLTLIGIPFPSFEFFSLEGNF